MHFVLDELEEDAAVRERVLTEALTHEMDITLAGGVKQRFKLITNTRPQQDADKVLFDHHRGEVELNVHTANQINNEMGPRLHRPINCQTPRRQDPAMCPAERSPPRTHSPPESPDGTVSPSPMTPEAEGSPVEPHEANTIENNASQLRNL